MGQTVCRERQNIGQTVMDVRTDSGTDSERGKDRTLDIQYGGKDRQWNRQ